MQMSKDQLFVFVEGRDIDPYFYARLCRPVCDEFGKSLEVVIADRLLGRGGGKNVLIQFFKFLQSNGALSDRSYGVTKAAFFFLDKDVDDLFKRAIQSPHITYTRFYCVENHLFVHGNIQTSIAVAATLDPGPIQRQIPDASAWRQAVARMWVDWLALCLVAKRLSLTASASYSRARSAVNDPIDAPTDPAQFAGCVAAMKARTTMPANGFDRLLDAAANFADRTIGANDADKIFKGKWYVAFSEREASAAGGRVPFNRNGFGDRLIAALLTTIDFDDPWTDHFRQPLRRLLSAL
jgi:hypothetical protein